MKRAGFWFLVLGTVLIVLSAAADAFSAQPWSESRVVSGGALALGLPQMWGGRVYYYASAAVGKADVWVWDQTAGARPLLQSTGYQVPLAVYGTNLVVNRYDSTTSKFSLYLYDPVNGERLITTTAGDSGHYPAAAIYGNTVVWEDMRSGVEQIYSWDPVNGERHIAPSTHAQTNPRIWGNTVVWEEASGGVYPYDKAVNVWNPTDGRTWLGWYNSPAISQNGIFMFQPYDPNHPSYGGGIYKWTAGGYQALYSEQNSYWQYSQYPQAWGDLYVWASGAWDPVNGVTHYAQATGGYYSGHSLYGHQVAWSDGHDIYIDTFVPEPSGLCALMLGLAGVCGSILRSKKKRS